MLLHVEELQMQKDIRNYDMKGVVFQQEKGDSQFLILEVSHRLGTSVWTEPSFTVFLFLLEARSLHWISQSIWCKLFNNGLRDPARRESNKILIPRYVYTSKRKKKWRFIVGLGTRSCRKPPFRITWWQNLCIRTRCAKAAIRRNRAQSSTVGCETWVWFEKVRMSLNQEQGSLRVHWSATGREKLSSSH